MKKCLKVATSFDEIEKTGEFVRKATAFHNKVNPDCVENGRFALYVSLACPWAHRCLIFRAMKGLEKAINVQVVHPVWGEIEEGGGTKSWVFGDVHGDAEFGGVSVRDACFNSRALAHVYAVADPDYSGKTTVPVLFDTKEKKIVNNESSEIICMFNSAFNKLAEHPDVDLLPADLEKEIQQMDDRMYNSFNNGVYRAGFATTQPAHDKAVREVFEFLDYAEGVLEKRPFLLGDRMTSSDIRMFVTALRFDPVYHTHFKCAEKRIQDEYPAVQRWMEKMLQMKEIRGTVSYTHIKHHYYRSHPKLNPYGLVPKTKEDDFKEKLNL